MLIGDVLELARCADEFPSDFIGELDDGDEIADAEPEAHLIIFFAVLALVLSED